MKRYQHYCEGKWIPGERLGCTKEHPVKLQQEVKDAKQDR